MAEHESVHPDEGTIHAWLDGALDAEESARLETHVATCASCAERVAEARGFIAGASRVVGLLDAMPAPLIKPAVTPTAARELSLWRALRVTPARASIAAVLLVAVGIVLTRQPAAVDTVSELKREAPSAMVATAPAASPAPAQDSVLSSAIARKLSQENPQRGVSSAAGPAIPVAPPPSAGGVAQRGDALADARVAAGRASLQAQSDAVGAPADRSRVAGVAGGVAQPTAERSIAAAKAGDAAAAPRTSAVAVASSLAGTCYRLESSSAGAMWGSAPLPVILSFESNGQVARVLTPNGSDTEVRTTLATASEDSVMLRLRRIGYAGTLKLSGSGDTRTGLMQSGPQTMQLNSVVVTGSEASSSRAARRDVAAPKVAAPPPPASQVRTDSLRAAPAFTATGVAVTARKVACP